MWGLSLLDGTLFFPIIQHNGGGKMGDMAKGAQALESDTLVFESAQLRGLGQVTSLEL